MPSYRSFNYLIVALLLLLMACSGTSTQQMVERADGAIPEGALQRLGKGRISDIQYGQEEASLVVATSVGIYYYTLEPLAEQWSVATDSPAQVADISGEGGLVAAGLGDGTVIIFDADDGSILARFSSVEAAVESLDFPREDTLLIGYLNGRVDLLTLAADGSITEQTLEVARLTSGVSALAYEPDEARLAVGTRRGDIFTLTEGDQTPQALIGHSNNTTVTSLTWSEDGSELLSTGRDESAYLWDVETGAIIDSLEDSGADVLAGAMTAEGQLEFVTQDGLFIYEDGQTSLPSSPVTAALSATGASLAAALDDGQLSVWPINAAQALGTPETIGGYSRNQSASFAAFSNDGSVLASSLGNEVIIWNTETWVIDARLGPFDGAVTSGAWAPSGTLLAVGTRNGDVSLWNTSNASFVREFQGHTGLVNSIAWEAGGSRFATVSGIDTTMIIWETASGEVAQAFDGVRDLGYYSIDWSGEQLATGLGSGNSQLWDTSALLDIPFDILRAQTDWVGAIAYSHDGQLVAAGAADFTTTIWDAQTGDQLTRVGAHTAPLRGVAWAPDDSALVTVAQDGLTMIWQVNADGEELQRTGVLGGHTDGVLSVDWAPDGESFATSSDDGTVIIWDAAEANNQSP